MEEVATGQDPTKLANQELLIEVVVLVVVLMQVQAVILQVVVELL